jgi:hypothetical protein
MTGQIPENLLIGDLSLSMTTEPVFESSIKEREKYINLEYDAYIPHNETNQIRRSTALDRARINTWEIKDNRLFYAYPIPKEKRDPAKTKVNSKFLFASSFSGVLRAWLGNRLEYVHLGFFSKYEHDIFFSFSQGELVSFWILHNTLQINCYPEQTISPLKLVDLESGIYYCKYCNHLATSIGHLPSITTYSNDYYDEYEDDDDDYQIFCNHEWHKIDLDEEYLFQCNICGDIFFNTTKNIIKVCKCIFNKPRNNLKENLKLKKLFNPNLFFNSTSKKFNFDLIKKYYIL